MTTNEKKEITNKEKGLTVFFIRFFFCLFFFFFLAFYFSLLFFSTTLCGHSFSPESPDIISIASHRIASIIAMTTTKGRIAEHRILDKHTERTYWQGMAWHEMTIKWQGTLTLAGESKCMRWNRHDENFTFSPFSIFILIFVLHHIPPHLFDSVSTGFFSFHFNRCISYHLISSHVDVYSVQSIRVSLSDRSSVNTQLNTYS